MAAMAALQSSMASVSLLPSAFLGQRFPHALCTVPVKSVEKPCLIVMKLKRWERKECKPNSLPVLQKIHVKVGDTVKIISGRDKGKIGEITGVFRHNSTVLIKEINLKTKHVKSREEGEPGQIIKIEAPIHSSNVMLFSKEQNVASRVGHKILEDGTRLKRWLHRAQSLDPVFHRHSIPLSAKYRRQSQAMGLRGIPCIQTSQLRNTDADGTANLLISIHSLCINMSCTDYQKPNAITSILPLILEILNRLVINFFDAILEAESFFNKLFGGDDQLGLSREFSETAIDYRF
ncbi:hypothetical protein NE237_032868 [Protea cynaroides]|uniref:KOW domain-containing protein n=1 Tax=Protea cynaroides TaxID=273540 RepID=A0A9Q0L4C0_9MAGN|nr:hypothetical protein NE237_032868 [Protea cynaroides]